MPRPERQAALSHLLPSASLRGPQLSPRPRLHRAGLLSLFWLLGQKGPDSKNMPYSTPTPHCCFPGPRSISQPAVRSCSREVKPAEATGGGWEGGRQGVASQLSTLAFPQISLVSCGCLANANGAGMEGVSLQVQGRGYPFTATPSPCPPSRC